MNNCFSKFSNRVLPPIFISTILQNGNFLNLAHYFPYDVKLRLLAHSRSFLANQKARNAIVGAENLLTSDIFVICHSDTDDCKWENYQISTNIFWVAQYPKRCCECSCRDEHHHRYKNSFFNAWKERLSPPPRRGRVTLLCDRQSKFRPGSKFVTWANPIAHFRVLLCLCLKTSLSAKPFIWKWVLPAGSLHANQSHFHKKGFALRLVLKHRGPRKWPIQPIRTTGSSAFDPGLRY